MNHVLRAECPILFLDRLMIGHSENISRLKIMGAVTHMKFSLNDNAQARCTIEVGMTKSIIFSTFPSYSSTPIHVRPVSCFRIRAHKNEAETAEGAGFHYPVFLASAAGRNV
jgi:hypothetical protein